MNVHLLHALNLASLYETAELGDGLPFLLLYQLSISCSSSFTCCVCLLLAFRHGGHVHGHDHDRGHHHGHHENRNRHERGQERQPCCILVGYTAAGLVISDCSAREEVEERTIWCSWELVLLSQRQSRNSMLEFERRFQSVGTSLH